jgi:hypothetical protein
MIRHCGIEVRILVIGSQEDVEQECRLLLGRAIARRRVETATIRELIVGKMRKKPPCRN